MDTGLAVALILGVTLVELAFLFGFPLFLLLWCWLSRDGGPRARRWAWTAVVVLLWPFGSVLYGLVGSRSRLVGTLSVLLVLPSLWLIGASDRERRTTSLPQRASWMEEYEAIAESERLRLTRAWGELAKAGYGNYLKVVEWSEDGERVLVGRAASLRLHETSGRELLTLEKLPSNSQLAGWFSGKWLGRGEPIALSDDGRWALADEGNVTLRGWLGVWVLARQLLPGSRRLSWWNLEDGRSGHLRAHGSTLKAIEFRPSSSEALSAGLDDSVQLWDAERGRRIETLGFHPGGVHSLAISRDGRLALSGGTRGHWNDPWDGVLQLWDLETRRPLRKLDGHSERVLGVAFSPDSRTAISASYDKTFRFWDVASGTETRSIATRVIFDNVAFSPDARFAASGIEVVEIWDLERGSVVDAIPLREVADEAKVIAFSPRGDELVIGTRRGALLFFAWKDELG